jgi:hypothetical protein
MKSRCEMFELHNFTTVLNPGNHSFHIQANDAHLRHTMLHPTKLSVMRGTTFASNLEANKFMMH